MRWSAEKLGWLSLGGALLLAGVLAAILGLANYRAGKVWQRILKRNGVNLTQESNGITYSQSVKGRTVFTLHAEKSTPHGNGVYSLHNAVLILYGKDGRDDRIRGNEFEYDQQQGILRAVGEVHMDLQAPATSGNSSKEGNAPLTFNAQDDTAAENDAVIHVRTSGLVFLRKLEVAATREPVEFRYRGLRCESLGAEFDSEQSVLHLLAAVQMAGSLHQQPFVLTAGRADLDRRLNTIALSAPDWKTAGRTARADHALLTMRKDGALDTAAGRGHVALRSNSQILQAPAVDVSFGPENRPQRASFTGGVQFADAAPQQQMHGYANDLSLTADPTGALRQANAEGAVQLAAEQGDPQQPSATRTLKAQRAEAYFVPGAGPRGGRLQRLHLLGSAEITAAALDARGKQTRLETVSAEDLLTTFASEVASDGTHAPEPEEVHGVGHTVLIRTGDRGERQRAEGDTLEAQFRRDVANPGLSDRSGLRIVTAVQTGHVVLQAWPVATGGAPAHHVAGRVAAPQAAEPWVGRAERAAYAAEAGTLTLTAANGRRAEVGQGSLQMFAPTIVLHEGSGDAEATGGVAATTFGATALDATTRPEGAATHVLAETATFAHALGTAHFRGTEANPAQLWQGGSQISAADLLLDSRRHTLTGRPAVAGGLVHAVFAAEHATVAPASTTSAPAAQREDPSSTGPEAVRVAADALDYSDPDHEAIFQGRVVLRSAEGTLSGDRGTVFLQPGKSSGAEGLPAPGVGGGALLNSAGGVGGRLQRFVLLGNVHLQQPGRSGVGQQLTYAAQTDQFVLTGSPGTPPRVADAAQGVVTGDTLVFLAKERSVVVASLPGAATIAGQPGSKRGAAQRVHTETDIKR